MPNRCQFADCRHDNEADARYCRGCGRPLSPNWLRGFQWLRWERDPRRPPTILPPGPVRSALITIAVGVGIILFLIGLFVKDPLGP